MYESLENPGSTVLRLEPHARDKEQRETRPTDSLEHCLKIRYTQEMCNTEQHVHR